MKSSKDQNLTMLNLQSPIYSINLLFVLGLTPGCKIFVGYMPAVRPPSRITLLGIQPILTEFLASKLIFLTHFMYDVYCKLLHYEIITTIHKYRPNFVQYQFIQLKYTLGKKNLETHSYSVKNDVINDVMSDTQITMVQYMYLVSSKPHYVSCKTKHLIFSRSCHLTSGDGF